MPPIDPPSSPIASRAGYARRIGLLGGSFNPAHEGHREISLAALNRLKLDAVWWLVTPGNPLKNKHSYAPYRERLQRARIVADHPNIVVSDFENRHNLQYTVETLAAIKAMNPDTAPIWLMGADGLKNFHRWRDWRRIAETTSFAVFNRPGYGDDALSSEAAKALCAFRLDVKDADQLWTQAPPAWIFFPDTNNPASSTQLRRKLRNTPISDSAKTPNPDPTPATKTTTPELTAPFGALAFFLDLHPDLGDFRDDTINGLSQPNKSLSPKYFYDEYGSKLFNHITALEEYYPTRTERKVFEEHGSDIAKMVGAGAGVFEYGSGSSEKIAWLINGLENPAAYVALDISRDHLLESAEMLAKTLPVPVGAVCADFHAPVSMPANAIPTPDHWLGYFPGSTIGNMAPETAIAFLNRASKALGPGAQFLIGLDLEKDKTVLEAAYNDKDGVTAAFNLNLLERMKRELGADLKIEDFEHHAFYNETASRIEMHLRAVRATTITIDEHAFAFDAGETLHTENSHKFTLENFAALVNKTPWRLEKSWTDANGWYAACLLSNN